MRERFEEMARMREHVFGELDHDKDKLISLNEFLNYTASQEFEKDEGWKVWCMFLTLKHMFLTLKHMFLTLKHK